MKKDFVNFNNNYKIKATSRYLSIYLFDKNSNKVFTLTLPASKFLGLFIKDLASQNRK